MYTRADCEAIRKDLNIALGEIGKRHNTKLQVGNIRHGTTELSISIKGMLIEDPDVSPEQALFNRLAPSMVSRQTPLGNRHHRRKGFYRMRYQSKGP